MLHLLLFLRAEPEALGKDWDTNLSVPQSDLQNWVQRSLVDVEWQVWFIYSDKENTKQFNN